MIKSVRVRFRNILVSLFFFFFLLLFAFFSTLQGVCAGRRGDGVHVCVRALACKCLRVLASVCVRVSLNVRMYVCVCASAQRVYMCACVHVCMCTCTRAYVCVSKGDVCSSFLLYLCLNAPPKGGWGCLCLSPVCNLKAII